MSIVFVNFDFYLKVSLKNIKQVIHEEDVFDVIHKYHNIMDNPFIFKNNLPSDKATWDKYICLTFFLQVFSISVRSDSDSDHQRASLLWL